MYKYNASNFTLFSSDMSDLDYDGYDDSEHSGKEDSERREVSAEDSESSAEEGGAD